jgi:ribosomal protein S2
MSEEGQEDFLGDFLPIMRGNAKRECITQKRVAKLLKELHDLTRNLRGLRRMRRFSGVWEMR